MPIRVATFADLPLVMALRMRFFHEFCEAMSASEIESVERSNRSFLESHLNSPLSRTWIAEIDCEAVASGTVTFFVQPQGDGAPATLEAYLHNIYTLPEYRKRGFASAILAAAMSYARSQGLKRVWLHATDAGRQLYQAAGFQDVATDMRLKSA